MNCPTCQNPMITLELSDVEVDHCVHCGGIWLDRGELEILLGNGEKTRHLLASFREAPAGSEASRKCPICRKRMTKIMVGSAPPPLLIDKCRRSDGLWFDKGELQDILERGELDQDSRIRHLLGDMFGRTGQQQHTGSGS